MIYLEPDEVLAIACEVLGFEADALVRATGPGLTNSDGGQRTHGLLRRALAGRSLFDQRPDSFQWQVGAQFLAELVVVAEHGVEQIVGVPHPNAEELAAQLLAGRLVDTAPGDEQRLVCAVRAEHAMQFPNDLHVHGRRAGLDLHNEARTVESQGALSGEDIDAAVRAGRRHLRGESLRFEDFGHQVREAMAGELLGNEGLDLVPAKALEVEGGLR